MPEVNSLYLIAAKILTYTALSFLIAMWLGPVLIRLLRWLKFWKKKSRDIAATGEELVVTKEFYKNDEAKMKIPRAGGILIWFTTLSFAIFFWIILKIEPTSSLTQFLNFISRSETFIPLGTLFFGSIFGFIDDALSTLETGGNYKAGGLKLSQRIILISILSLGIGYWFYDRLNLIDITLIPNILNLQDINNLIPLLPEFTIIQGFLESQDINNLIPGILIIPATLIALLSLWSSSVIDGFDGIAAGTFIPIFLCFAGLSFARGFFDIATLLMVIVGSMTAYLWYNIPPAKFYMGDTGTTGLMLTLGVVAFLIDAVYVVPVAGFLLVLTSASNVIQVFSKKVFKKKVFLAAPFHHHLEALGWERNQITMRYWLISIMCSVLGLAIGLIFR